MLTLLLQLQGILLSKSLCLLHRFLVGLYSRMSKFNSLIEAYIDQKEGVEYIETFAPIVRHISIRIIIYIALLLGWPIYKMDITMFF